MFGRMPTMKQNISYWHQQLMLKHGATVKHVLKSAVLLILAALVLETFVFNFNYFRTAGYHTTNLDNRLSLTKTLDNQYRVTEVNHVIEFKNLNSEVHNVWLNFDYRQPAQQLKVKISSPTRLTAPTSIPPSTRWAFPRLTSTRCAIKASTSI